MSMTTKGSKAWRFPFSLVALDVVDRLFVLGLYGWLVWRILAAYFDSGNVANLVLLSSEGLVVLFILIRRQTSQVSRHPGEWLLAMAATCAPLLVRPSPGWPLVSPTPAVMLMLVGMLMQVYAKLVLGRSFGMVPANRGLKLSGPYRIVRHPIYAGYLLTHTGFLLLNPSVWNLAAYVVAYSLQIPRLLAEERLLSRDPSYVEYSDIVRYRLLPRIF